LGLDWVGLSLGGPSGDDSLARYWRSKFKEFSLAFSARNDGGEAKSWGMGLQTWPHRSLRRAASRDLPIFQGAKTGPFFWPKSKAELIKVLLRVVRVD
jgi:hypothetical protein